MDISMEEAIAQHPLRGIKSNDEIRQIIEAGRSFVPVGSEPSDTADSYSE